VSLPARRLRRRTQSSFCINRPYIVASDPITALGSYALHRTVTRNYEWCRLWLTPPRSDVQAVVAILKSASAFNLGNSVITHFRKKRQVLAQFSVVLLSALFIAGHTGAQMSNKAPQPPDSSSPWNGQDNPAAQQADAWYDNYKFRDGSTIARLRIHYATLGKPHRDSRGDIDNAVLVLHWTGADGRSLHDFS